jgi:UDP-2,3-diacylglucosamine pyrophosphatase LpxH
MPAMDDFNIAIISDLHLSEGRNPRTKKFNRNEDFFFDGEFDRFLSHLETDSKRRGRHWRLIIAGDMLDFLQVTSVPDDHVFDLRKSEKTYGLGTGPEKTAWKMKTMMDGHWAFFMGLGRFISFGNRCTIISGNHDIEWSMPVVQEAFREEMEKRYLPHGTRDPQGVVSNGIEFCPWFYYEPELIWIEHGHQYDGMNSFDSLLAPNMPNSKELMLPGGSFFVRYLFNKVETIDPFADNIKPTSAYVRSQWVKLMMSRNVRKHLVYFLDILRKIRKFGSEELMDLQRENEEQMRTQADRFGIQLHKLEAIRSKWVPCFFYNKSRLENVKRFFTYHTGNIHRQMASWIREQLGVRYVVFGHTHRADLHILSPGGKAEYANSGTWTKIFSNNPTDRLLNEQQEFVFVQILKDEGNKLLLMRWTDAIGRGERLNLFDYL